MAFSNGLSDAELERLAFLAEEMGEALQCIGKIQRHGYESYNPVVDTGMTNRRELERELGDVHAAIQLLTGIGDICGNNMLARKAAKLKNVQRWMHHQPKETDGAKQKPSVEAQ